MKRILTAIGLCLCAVIASSASGDDWQQYRGPQRDDVSQETGLAKSWPAEGPPHLWTYREAGIGYSGMSIVGDRLYTIGGRGDAEFLIALDLASGKAPSEAWSTRIGPLFQWEGNRWSAGPSSTPTVDGDLMFALGGMGDLVCVDSSSGKEVWRKNLPADLAAEVNPVGGGPKKLGWGFTWSPLVDGEQLICLPGGPQGTVAALDKRTGRVLWQSAELTDQAAYTSPTPATIGGVRQFVVLTNLGVYGVAAENGKLLWSYPRKFSTEVVNSPSVQGSLVYVTVGAGQGCELLKVSQVGGEFTAENVYSNKNMANHHGNVVLWGDHVYGNSMGKGWICQDFKSGEIVWDERRKLRGGSLTYADGHLYCYSEDNGTVALVEASPTAWNETGRVEMPEQSTLRKPNGKIWTPPVVANGRLFLRDQELIHCFDVKARP